jgi:hypothetical protein
MKEMRTLTKTIIATTAMLVCMQGMCAVKFEITENNDGRVCPAFFKAVENSRLSAMDDKQLCIAANSQVSDLLHSASIKDVAWKELPASTKADQLLLSHKLFGARYDDKWLATANKDSINDFFVEFARIIDSAGLVEEEAQLHTGGQTYFALQLRRTDCNSARNGDDGTPLWGIFSDASHTTKMPVSSFTPEGTPFYIDKHLVVLELGTRAWFPLSPSDPNHVQLMIAVSSIDPWIGRDGKTSLVTGDVCAISIKK